MKRFLILSLVVVFLVAILAVPALAAESYLFDSDCDGELAFNNFPPDGEYVAHIVYFDVFSRVVCDFYTEPFLLMYFDDHPYDEEAYLYEVVSVSSVPYYVTVDYQEDWEAYRFTLYDSNDQWLHLDSLEFIPFDSGDPSVSVFTTDSVFAVFAGIGAWLVSELGNVTSLFYQADSGLTLLGVLAVCGLGLAVVFLLISWVRNLLQFRS